MKEKLEEANCSPWLISILLSCVSPKPLDRPNATQLFLIATQKINNLLNDVEQYQETPGGSLKGTKSLNGIIRPKPRVSLDLSTLAPQFSNQLIRKVACRLKLDGLPFGQHPSDEESLL